MKVIAIAAADQGRVIGFEGRLPWRIPEDMKRFSQLTRGHTVLMGRKTYESLPQEFRPLPQRRNIVVSRTLGHCGGEIEVFTDLDACLKKLRQDPQVQTLWIIGGEEIYRQTLPSWDEVHLTLVTGKHQGDAYFPEFEDSFELVERLDKPGYSFLHYKRR